MTPEEIRSHRFTVFRRRPGYDIEQVDQFLKRAASALEQLAAGRRSLLGLTGDHVRATRFARSVSRTAYDEAEVDRFLTAVAAALDAAASSPAPGAGRRRLSLTAEEVVNQRFQATKFREGYDQDEVDAFLDAAVAALTEAAAGRPYQHLLSAADVVAVRFQATKFREGYDQDEVDDFLDRLAEALR